jgi:4-hydroxy-tetrahydrodipicolinate reductase
MKIALIGYGAMGRLVAAHASAAGDEVGLTLSGKDLTRSDQDLIAALRPHDVAIDFSIASAVLKNIEICANAGVPLIEGTTGWQAHEAEARRIVHDQQGALVFGANFSIGVNLFYRIVAQTASLFAALNDYAPFIEEAHHSRKRDAPSGTALRLKSLMREHFQTEIPVTATRAGYIPGTHRVGFDSAADQILLTHEARSRDGFAAGALLAARWIVGRKGVYEFAEVIDELMTSNQKDSNEGGQRR